jgi:UDP-N-acetylmuramoyl-tripeptide--D-alanyl-D-alanine ligase
MSSMMTLYQAWQWLLPQVPGARLVGDGSVQISRVHTDSRSLLPGDLFVALKGERFDANAFLGEAKASGAVAAIAQADQSALAGAAAGGRLAAAGLSGIEVPDSRLALGALAAGWRSQFSLPLIAVTGSNGKTTVTQMIAAILRAYRPGQVLATEGNFNNDIGVPLTLLRLRAEHALAVVELGMNHPGEIAGLAAMARPTVALVNNAQREHLEFMATVDAVARENGAVIAALGPQGTAVFPAGDAHSATWSALAGERQCLRFGALGGADVYCDAPLWDGDAWSVVAHTGAGSVAYRLHIAGRHNVTNSLAALACALAAGVPLASAAQGLTGFEPVKGRSRALRLTWGGRELTLVDDSYNANPDSVRAAIEVLADLPGPRLLLLGDMGEVGDRGAEFHAEIGAYARACGVDHLLALGALTSHAVDAFNGAASAQQGAGAQQAAGAACHCQTLEALVAAACELLDGHGHGGKVTGTISGVASIVVKGSRFMKMERVIDGLRAAGAADAVRLPASVPSIPGGAACW